MKKKQNGWAHWLGLLGGVTGLVFILYASFKMTPTLRGFLGVPVAPIISLVAALYGLLAIKLMEQKLALQGEWGVNIQFIKPILRFIAIGAPLCIALEIIRWLSDPPKADTDHHDLNNALRIMVYLVMPLTLGFWYLSGVGTNKKLPNSTRTLPRWWCFIRTKVFGLENQTEISRVALEKWANGNLLLGAVVFVGILTVMQWGKAFANGTSTLLVILAAYFFTTTWVLLYAGKRWFFCHKKKPHLVFSAMEVVQLIFVATQRWAIIWMLLLGISYGPEIARVISGFVLGIESPLCNIFRIALALLAIAIMNGFPKNLTPQEKSKERWKRVKTVFLNGPFFGLVGGVGVYGLGIILSPVFPIVPVCCWFGDLLGYFFVPMTLHLLGELGQLREVVSWNLQGEEEIKKREGSQRYGRPIFFTVLLAMVIIPIFAHFGCNYMYTIGWMDHLLALELARFFSHGCSITAWGVLILMWKPEETRLYLLLFLVTTAVSVFTVPAIYKYCAF